MQLLLGQVQGRNWITSQQSGRVIFEESEAAHVKPLEINNL